MMRWLWAIGVVGWWFWPGVSGTLSAAEHFPAAEWRVASSPEAAGWSSEALAKARAHAEGIDTAAVVVVHGGVVVDQWGEVVRPFNCHSMRKSMLSALYGLAVAAGQIDLDHTLAELGINDNEPSLTELERTATVRQLLQARSGIYHSALYETARMKARRPERGSHAPGEFWYYNNWDFNALGAIFEQRTASSFFGAFERQLARPLGMQDFDRAQHTGYVTGDDSVYPAYPLRLSARDLARFGLLFARGGRWHDRQLIPAEWVKESTTSYSDAGESGGYGYMWWVARDGVHYPHITLPEGSFAARGAGGHSLLIVPKWDLVIAHRVNTFQNGRQVSSEQLGQLLALIVASMPADRQPTIADEGNGSNNHDAAGPPARYDLLLAGGRVMDGTGNPWFQADVALSGGRIVAVGKLNRTDAARVIDVAGKVVAPGFIDMHSHADRGLTSDETDRRAALNLVSQGVTTVAINQDGFGPATLGKQLQEIERLGAGPNVAPLVGHGGIRSAVMQSDHRRPARPDEVQRMRQLVREAMDLGAFGLSGGLEYVPGRWSTTDELKALVAELAPYDGVFVVHERSSGADPMWYLPSRDDAGQPSMIDNIREQIEIAESTGVRVVQTHIKARGANFWGSSRVMIQLIEDARRRGVRIFADQYPYNTSGSDGNVVLIPAWLADRLPKATTAKFTPAELLERALADESLAADVRKDIEHEIVRRGGPGQIVVMQHPDKALVGKTLAEVAAQWDASALETAIRLQLQGNRKQAGGARLRGYSMSEADVEAFAARPWVATCSDAGIALPSDGPNTHPRYYGTYPRKIGYYARTRGVQTVEDAIRASTSLPAQLLGIRDRGQVREGFHADLVVFDLDQLRDTSVAGEPHQYAEGVEYVLVGGQFVVDAGQLTRALPGQVLRKPRGPSNN